MLEAIYASLLTLGMLLCARFLLRTILQQGLSVFATRPSVVFSIYFLVIHFVTPLYKFMLPKYRYQMEYNSEVLVYTALLSLLAYGIALICLEGNKHRALLHGVPRPGVGAQAAILTGLLLFLLGFYASWQARGAIIQMGGAEAFLADRIAASTGLGGIGRAVLLMTPGSTLFLAGWLNLPRRKRRIYVALSAAMIVYCASYFLLISSRNSFLVLVLSHLAVFSLYRPIRLNLTTKGLRNLILIGLLGGILLQQAYNTTFKRFDGRSGAYAAERLDNIWFSLLDGAFGNDENLLWLTENGHSLYLGQTYAAGFLNLVPRRIWEDKPWGAGPEIKNLIYPGSYRRGAEGNSSITTGMLAEARMNLGVIGVLGIPILWAFVVMQLVRLLYRCRTIIGQTTCIIVILAMSSAFVYSEFLGFFGRVFLTATPVLLLGTIINLFLQKRSPQRAQGYR